MAPRRQRLNSVKYASLVRQSLSTVPVPKTVLQISQKRHALTAEDKWNSMARAVESLGELQEPACHTHSSSFGQQSSVKAEFPWAPCAGRNQQFLFQVTPVCCHLSVTSHSLLWSTALGRQVGLPLAGETFCFWQSSSALLPKQQ